MDFIFVAYYRKDGDFWLRNRRDRKQILIELRPDENWRIFASVIQSCAACVHHRCVRISQSLCYSFAKTLFSHSTNDRINHVWYVISYTSSFLKVDQGRR